MNELLIDLLQQAPWLVWVYIGAAVVATVFRASYPDVNERPRWMVGILALCDVLQVNPGSLISSARRAAK